MLTLSWHHITLGRGTVFVWRESEFSEGRLAISSSDLEIIGPIRVSHSWLRSLASVSDVTGNLQDQSGQEAHQDVICSLLTFEMCNTSHCKHWEGVPVHFISWKLGVTCKMASFSPTLLEMDGIAMHCCFFSSSEEIYHGNPGTHYSIKGHQ